jgi:hypothetical protein
VTDDWDPSDPDAVRVHYELGAWTFEQQAELAAELADASIPHTWDGSELVVPEHAEAATDSVIASVEQWLGIVDDQPREGFEPVAVAAGVPTTEYELDDWSAAEREAVSNLLADGQVPFRWEGTSLVVPTDDEVAVDAVLDAIESGQHVGAVDVIDDDETSTEILTTFFLAGDRLKRNPLDAAGLEELLRALELATPDVPPFGIERALWNRCCTLADELADALVGEDEPDHDEASRVAGELHELLRPYI